MEDMGGREVMSVQVLLHSRGACIFYNNILAVFALNLINLSDEHIL